MGSAERWEQGTLGRQGAEGDPVRFRVRFRVRFEWEEVVPFLRVAQQNWVRFVNPRRDRPGGSSGGRNPQPPGGRNARLGRDGGGSRSTPRASCGGSLRRAGSCDFQRGLSLWAWRRR